MTVPDFFLIFFIEQLFLIFNQMLSIRAFGRRDTYFQRLFTTVKYKVEILDWVRRLRHGK